MKITFTLLALLATSSLVATISCSDRAKDPDSTAGSASTSAVPGATTSTVASSIPDVAVAPVAAAVPANPFVEISAVLTKTTKDQTAALAVPQQNMDRAINAQIEAWKLTGATSTAKNDEKLALARTDFTQKLRSLSTADDATWRNAKSEALASLLSLEQAFRELLAGPVKN